MTSFGVRLNCRANALFAFMILPSPSWMAIMSVMLSKVSCHSSRERETTSSASCVFLMSPSRSSSTFLRSVMFLTTSMLLVVLRTPFAFTSSLPSAGVNTVSMRSASPRRRWRRMIPSVLYSLALFGILALHLLTPLERTRKRHVVRVLQVTAHRQATGETRDLQTERTQQPCQVHRGRFTLQVRVGCQDRLLHLSRPQALEKFGDLQVLRPDAVHRRDRAVKDVMQPTV